MNFKKELSRAVKIAKLDIHAMHSVAQDKEATGPALTMIVLASMAGAIGSFAFPVRYGPVVYRPTLFEAFSHALIGFVLVLGLIYGLHLLADHFFKGQNSFESFLRVMGYGYVIGFLNVFPVLTLVVAIWMVVILIKSLVEVKKLTAEHAVISFVIAVVSLFVLFGLFQGLNAANLYGGLYLSPY